MTERLILSDLMIFDYLAPKIVGNKCLLFIKNNMSEIS